MAATKSASLIHIMVPPMMGYLIPSIPVIFVSIMSVSFDFSLLQRKLERVNAWRLGSLMESKILSLQAFQLHIR
jgi:hypothetical protein